MIPFSDRLARAVRQRATPVLVGLDPRRELLPPGMLPAAGSTSEGSPPGRLVAEAYCRFCREVIDVVAPLVPAVKPQAAFFEQLGPPGMAALGEVIDHARQQGLLVILDAKRGDIGSTAEAYADGLIGPKDQSPWGADAVTVNPYLGADSLAPFVQVARTRGAGLFVLVKTSNPGGGMLQDRVADERPIYRHVADHVEQIAAATAGECGYGVAGAVVGATYPAQLAELREAMPHAWILVPGFGAQGGTAADVAAGFDPAGLGAIVNSSRGIIFAHRRAPFAEQYGPSRWQQAVEAATREMIEQLRADTLAGRLVG